MPDKITRHQVLLYADDVARFRRHMPDRLLSPVLRNLLREFLATRHPEPEPDPEPEIDLE